jgi:uncharacterized membrane protein
MRASEREMLQALHERLARLEREVARLRGTQGENAPAEEEPAAAGEFVFEEPLPGEPTPTRPPQPSAESLETAIGTRWIGRVGMVAVVLGVAYFLKFAFDNNLIGPTGRVALGLAAGVAFLFGGEWLRTRRGLPGYAQILSGGGIAILYFALYAAWAFYHLIPAAVAFAAFVAVTTTGMTLAVRTDAVSLAALGLLGGMLTPVLLSTGENRPLSLFGYLLLLDAGIVAVVHLRRWKWLAAVSLVGTALLYAAWHDRHFTADQQGLAFAVVTSFFLFYTGYVLLAEVFRRGRPLLPLELVFGNAAFYALAVWAQQGWQTTWTLKLFLLFLAAVEVGCALLHRRRFPAETGLAEGFAAASAIATVAATMALLDFRWLTAALAAEAAALIAVGVRADRRAVRAGGYLLTALTALRLADQCHLTLEPFERFWPLWNGRFLSGAVAVAACYLALFELRRGEARLPAAERYAAAAYFVLAQVATVWLLSLEVLDLFRFGRWPGVDIHYAQQASLSVVWALYAALLTGVGIARRLRLPRLLGIGLFAVTVVKVFFVDLSMLATVYRIVSCIILGLLLLGVSYAYNRCKDRLFGEKP